MNEEYELGPGGVGRPREVHRARDSIDKESNRLSSIRVTKGIVTRTNSGTGSRSCPAAHIQEQTTVPCTPDS